MNELDEYQSLAVVESSSAILIAGAGAGKTFTITKKLDYIINNNICKEDEILIISFTNKSVDDLIKKIPYKCSIKTFHKLAIQILDDYNIDYNLVDDDELTYVTNNFFSTLNDDKMIIEILKYFRESNYNKFLTTFKYKEFVKIITNIIKIYKTNDCSKEDFKRIYYKDKFLTKYIYIIMNVYETYLDTHDAFDFDDLIINATKVLNKYYKYKYIIVDEFQDTSRIRFNLINKIRILNNAILFVVGDDYQSIYHFSGCDINIFLDFTKLVPNSKILKLKYTYRNSQELIDISGDFVMKNKTQIQKELLSHKHIDKPIEFVYYINPMYTFQKLYDKLSKEYTDILVLGRNNFDIKKFTNKDVKYMTVHSSKGLEADAVILINMVDDVYGFPNKIVNNKLLEELYPSDRSYLYAEERRLFYVALTRTRNKVYIMTPIFNSSPFIKELKKIIKKKQ